MSAWDICTAFLMDLISDGAAIFRVCHVRCTFDIPYVYQTSTSCLSRCDWAMGHWRHHPDMPGCCLEKEFGIVCDLEYGVAVAPTLYKFRHFRGTFCSCEKVTLPDVTSMLPEKS